MSPRRGARTFRFALAFSALLHLSMVTIFRVVIYFPRQDIDYMRVDIVRTDIPRLRVQSGRLAMPSSEDAFERMNAEAGDSLLGSLDSEPPPLETSPDDPWAGLPRVQLPKLEFEELDRLRFQVRGLEVGKRYDDQFGRGNNLWSRFGRGLGSVTGALSSVVLGNRGDEEASHAIAVPDPAPGFDAYVEWLTPPYRREALGGARIEALWGRDPGSLREAIAIPFRVDAGGIVTEVLPPLEGDPAIVDDAMTALFDYRFERIGGDDSEAQMGTFVIRGESGW